MDRQLDRCRQRRNFYFLLCFVNVSRCQNMDGTIIRVSFFFKNFISIMKIRFKLFTSKFHFRDLRICSLKLEQVFAVWGIDWSTNYILKQSMEWVVLVIDLIDEMVEFVNLAFAAVLEPIIGLIQAGNPDQIVNIPV